MSTFKYFDENTKKVIASNLNQVIDVIQEDISGSATRRKYQTFVTGGIGPGVTSSLYQTVYDQDFTLQTSNPVLDMTIGLFHYDDGTNQRPNLVTTGTGYALSSTTGQLTFDSRHTMMMREKVNLYRQYAGYLLGDSNDAFVLDNDQYPSLKRKTTDGSPFSTIVKTDQTVIDAALFINVKRLFARDGIRKETFAIRLYKNAPNWSNTVAGSWNYHYSDASHSSGAGKKLSGYSALTSPKYNISGTAVSSSETGVQIIADLSAAQDNKDTSRGDVALLKLASDSTKVVGLIFYQAGVVVLNMGGSSVLSGLSHETTGVDNGLGQDYSTHKIQSIFEQRDHVYGIVSGMDNGAGTPTTSLGTKVSGQLFVGTGTQADNSNVTVSTRNQTSNIGGATFYPDLLVSASIDDIVDHVGYTRFSSGSLTGLAFQNQTKINSSIYFCRASANEFNVSNNPTWGVNGIGVMIQDPDDKAFTYITTVALKDEDDQIVAIAKLNRPIEKNEESELTIRVRLDF